MAGVAKGLLFVFVLMFTATTLAVPNQLSTPAKARFTCDKVVDIFMDRLNGKAKIAVQHDDNILAWGNVAKEVQCVGNNIARVTFRSYSVLLVKLAPKKHPTVTSQLCSITELTVIIGQNPDSSLTVEKASEVNLLDIRECVLEIEVEDEGAEPAASNPGGNPQLPE